MDEENVAGTAAPGKLRDRFYRRDPLRALQGMSSLSLEERGAYNVIIDLTYLRGRPPLDDLREMAHEMRVDIRVWRRIRASLISKGRLRIQAGAIVDDACLDELRRREAERRALADAGAEGGRKSAAARKMRGSSAGLPPDVGRTYGEPAANVPVKLAAVRSEIKGLGQARLNQSRVESSIEIEAYTGSTDAADLTDEQLQELCLKVAGPRLRRGHGLDQTYGVIGYVIRSGCSLERDVLPVVAARTKAEAGKGDIDRWNYFERAWFESRDARLAGSGDPIALAEQRQRQRRGSIRS